MRYVVLLSFTLFALLLSKQLFADNTNLAFADTTKQNLIQACETDLPKRANPPLDPQKNSVYFSAVCSCIFESAQHDPTQDPKNSLTDADWKLVVAMIQGKKITDKDEPDMGKRMVIGMTASFYIAGAQKPDAQKCIQEKGNPQPVR